MYSNERERLIKEIEKLCLYDDITISILDEDRRLADFILSDRRRCLEIIEKSLKECWIKACSDGNTLDGFFSLQNGVRKALDNIEELK